VAEGLGFHDTNDRSRRLHLLLDAYGYDGDRHAFGATVVHRARHQAGVMQTMAADAGDQAAIALLSVAGYMEQSAADVEALPEDFWVRGALTPVHDASPLRISPVRSTKSACSGPVSPAAQRPPHTLGGQKSTPGRRFTGIYVQGDTFAVLCGRLAETGRAIQRDPAGSERP
jgi:hypothetical protein